MVRPPLKCQSLQVQLCHYTLVHERHLTNFEKEAVPMARIPDEEIERLKKEVPIERLN
jgi:hypothetical protein